MLHKDTAGDKVASLLANYSKFRAAQVRTLEADPALTAGDVTSINLTVLDGGVQVNLVPPAMSVQFDIRLAVDVVHSEFEEMVNECRV